MHSLMRIFMRANFFDINVPFRARLITHLLLNIKKVCLIYTDMLLYFPFNIKVSHDV